jgi:hypothetical protein
MSSRTTRGICFVFFFKPSNAANHQNPRLVRRFAAFSPVPSFAYRMLHNYLACRTLRIGGRKRAWGTISINPLSCPKLRKPTSTSPRIIKLFRQ